MEKKEDRRVTMTRRMLKEALTELLRETDIYHFPSGSFASGQILTALPSINTMEASLIS